jgi:hypothetical protein
MTLTKPEKQFKDPSEYTVEDWLKVQQARRADQPDPRIETDAWAAYRAEVLEEAGINDEPTGDEDELRPLEERSTAEHLAAVQERNRPG